MTLKSTQTVSELNSSIKLLLENGFAFVSIIGELSNLRKPYSGHLYFSLKDNKSQLKCVLFKMQQRYLSKSLADGMQIICNGRISVYEPRGEYQLIIDSVDFKGEGDLQLAFEKLKQKLAAEGLFAADRKKKLPFLPDKIAVISSPQGAAIHDFLTVSKSRCPAIPIDIYPVRVQGEFAAEEIIASIKTINLKHSADVIVICRGGGSIEDLWCFNDEELAHAIFASEIPIVSAIGHEIDYTIADFTADLRAPTPTAAVEVVMPDYKTVSSRVLMSADRVTQAVCHKIAYLQEKLYYQKRLLQSPLNNIFNQKLQVNHNQERLINAIKTKLNSSRHTLSLETELLFRLNPSHKLKEQKLHLRILINSLIKNINNIIEKQREKLEKEETLLKAVSPLAVLGRGYAIVKKIPGQQIVRTDEDISEGELLEIILASIKSRKFPTILMQQKSLFAKLMAGI
jgi:exodeoxyribonuclease VII large subunit